MPITYELMDESGRFVYSRATGVLTDVELLSNEERLLKDSRICPGFRHLLDLRWVRDDRVTERVVDLLRLLHERYHDKVQHASYAVVAHSALWFRMGTCYSRHSELASLIVFNDPMTACTWLGLRDYLPDCQIWRPRRSKLSIAAKVDVA